MIDKTSFLHTVACSGCMLARSPPSLSLSAEGSKPEDTRLITLKNTDFSSCTEIGTANEAA